MIDISVGAAVVGLPVNMSADFGLKICSRCTFEFISHNLVGFAAIMLPNESLMEVLNFVDRVSLDQWPVVSRLFRAVLHKVNGPLRSVHGVWFHSTYIRGEYQVELTIGRISALTLRW